MHSDADMTAGDPAHETTSGLPADPDTASPDTTPRDRPAHLRPDYIGAVFVGGCCGVAAREALIDRFPTDGVPWTVFVINIVGAFLLGILLEALARRGPDIGRRRFLRMLVGTGFMGGFTTYSALATDAADLLSSGSPGAGAAYGVGTVIVGAIATWTGIAIGTLTHRTEGDAR